MFLAYFIEVWRFLGRFVFFRSSGLSPVYSPAHNLDPHVHQHWCFLRVFDLFCRITFSPVAASCEQPACAQNTMEHGYVFAFFYKLLHTFSLGCSLPLLLALQNRRHNVNDWRPNQAKNQLSIDTAVSCSIGRTAVSNLVSND